MSDLDQSEPILRIGQGSYEYAPRFAVSKSSHAGHSALDRVLIHEPADVYHAKREHYLSSHQLADFRRCPRLYRQKQLGLISDRDSAAYAFGRAAHVLVLEGRERFDAEFAVGGPTNEKTGKPYGSGTKAFAEWAEKRGKPVINESDLVILQEMHASVRGHLFARELLTHGVAEGVVRGEYCGLPCQARIDWINPRRGRGIVDLKTCADLDDFERDVHAYGYVHQMAFYREVLAVAWGVRAPVHLVAIEKREPYRCGVWQISRRMLDRAASENEAAIAELKTCRDHGEWHTRYESLRLIDIVGEKEKERP